ncbi:patatin-like phospholipase family protein [Aquibacillus salsiterrae]|uniref:Patatin-like phospholipase family protein n=1 Tax=Aquibacillus salsiterrae TaxID=2950439 RepID=A0A9X4AE81_9BACI|nr:patatin-like phospholipase family protein [Aquibacillus salsiterrae]MDC3416497.1 patatin-like phospholipase family protein [Aquibacillus salsiterrae]
MNNPKIGLALGSGGAKGFAHIGVLKVLLDNGINIDYVAGSSMGALIGSFYCAGQEVDHLYQLAKTFKRKFFLDFTVPKMGFIQGKRIEEYIQLFTYNKNIEDFPIPIGIVATNLYTGKKKVFYQGIAAEAVRASISIPGIFIPKELDNELYIDGGVIDRVPVSVVKEMGADIVIAVDCSRFSESTEIQSIFDVMLQSIDIMQDELVRNITIDADVMLTPDVSKYSSRAYTNILEIIKAGEKEAEEKVNDILQCIENWKGHKG